MSFLSELLCYILDKESILIKVEAIVDNLKKEVIRGQTPYII